MGGMKVRETSGITNKYRRGREIEKRQNHYVTARAVKRNTNKAGE